MGEFMQEVPLTSKQVFLSIRLSLAIGENMGEFMQEVPLTSKQVFLSIRLSRAMGENMGEFMSPGDIEVLNPDHEYV